MNKSKTFLSSLHHAYEGIKNFILFERNAKIHLIASVFAIVLGLFFNISILDWGLITIAITLVWGFELMNTAIEKVCDKFQPGIDMDIKIIKDLAAGSVLVSAIASILIGIFVFLPPIVQILRQLQIYK